MSAAPDWNGKFHEDLAVDAAVERGLLVKEFFVILIIVALIALREWLL